VLRTVLALFDGAVEPTPGDTRIHRHAELPLNHLGYIVEYADIRKALPNFNEIDRYAGIVTWFSAPVGDERAYLDWANQAAARQARFVILGDPGVSPWSVNVEPLNALLSRIGIHHSGMAVSPTLGARIDKHDPEVWHFERHLDPVLPAYPVIRTTRSDTMSLLTVVSPAAFGQRPSALAVVSPGGGYVASGYELALDPASGRTKWLINPFTFFHRALGAAVRPVADVTTMAGRRLFFSHVDGEGLHNLSQVPDAEGRRQLAGRLLLNAVFRAYKDLPVTFSVIGGDIDTEVGGNDRANDLLREVFALPHVELAINTHSWPLLWRPLEMVRADSVQPTGHTQDAAHAPIATSAATASNNEAGGRTQPVANPARRAYNKYPFEIATEVDRPRRLVEDLAPSSKRTAVFHWSGDARPSEPMLAATRAAGLFNINGGAVQTADEGYSLAMLSPLTRPVGRERQLYAPFGALAHTLPALRRRQQLIAETGAPLRLKPINLHYNIRAAERETGLTLIRSILDNARREQVFTITASQYARIVQGFMTMRMTQSGPLSWTIYDRGALQTLRFDAAESLHLDVVASRGVLGSNRYNGALYVTLDPDDEVPVVALDRGGRNLPASGLDRATIADSNVPVAGLSRKACRLDFRVTSASTPIAMTLAGLGPGDYAVRYGEGETAQDAGIVRSTSAGTLSLQLTLPPDSRTPVTILCINS
jgi:hypothetical protein